MIYRFFIAVCLSFAFLACAPAATLFANSPGWSFFDQGGGGMNIYNRNKNQRPEFQNEYPNPHHNPNARGNYGNHQYQNQTSWNRR